MVDSKTGEAGGRGALWQVWGGAIVVALVGLLIAWQFVGDPPPTRLVVATGSVGGGYHASARRLADALARDGIELVIRETAGSLENAALLGEGAVDLAYVQGGAVAEPPAEARAVCSLYYEPLWVFVGPSVEAERLADLAGLRLEAGGPGSGTRAVASALAAAVGLDLEGEDLRSSAPAEAVRALLAAECDALLMVNAATSEPVRALFAAPQLRALSLERAHALSRHFGYLEPLRLTPGMIDLVDNRPAEPVDLVAPAACLLAAESLHPAIPPLLIEAARVAHGGRGLFEDEGAFPSLRHVDVPPAEAAVRYFRDGPSFLYRVLPFQVAAVVDRMKIMLLPLITLLIPLMRVAPPAYRWRIRSRIVRWYRLLLEIESRVRAADTDEARRAAVAELARLDREIAEVKVPLGFAEELYNARMHVRLVRSSLERELAGRA